MLSTECVNSCIGELLIAIAIARPREKFQLLLIFLLRNNPANPPKSMQLVVHLCKKTNPTQIELSTLGFNYESLAKQELKNREFGHDLIFFSPSHVLWVNTAELCVVVFLDDVHWLIDKHKTVLKSGNGLRTNYLRWRVCVFFLSEVLSTQLIMLKLIKMLRFY